VISVLWFPIAYLLGRYFERAQADNTVTARAAAGS
jgi:hypothetical protein